MNNLKMRGRQLLILILCLTLIMGTTISAYGSESMGEFTTDTSNENNNEDRCEEGVSSQIDSLDTNLNTDRLRLSIAVDAADITSLAVQHLADMKITLSSNSGEFGFTALELAGLKSGSPFSVYEFGNSGQMISAGTIAFPLIYMENIVGVIEAIYDDVTNSYIFTFGKSYGNELNSLVNQSTLNSRNGLTIGHIGDKLFATDGEEVVILYEYPVENMQLVTIDQIETCASNIVLTTDSVYVDVMDSTDETKTSASAIIKRGPPTNLSVPHVAQTGVCGVAAWAAVLNFRFGTSYSNATLATAMSSAGYAATPNMYNYRDFANNTHSAGCVFLASPPSFNVMKAAIHSSKPIMGSWNSGSTGHAIIIKGYVENSANYIYYLKNPWYNYSQTITVTSASSVVYPDAGYTWRLNQSVY